MKNKEITDYIKTLNLVSITFFIVYILSVCLYFKTIFINEIVISLLFLACVAIYFSHDYLTNLRVYVISVIYALFLFVIVILTEELLYLHFSKWVLCLSIFPIVFLVFFNIFNFVFVKISKTNPLLTDDETYLSKVYFTCLIGVPLVMSFKISEIVKLYLL